MELTIDPEIRQLIPPLTPDERSQLETNLVADGTCHDPIKFWNGIVIDGHNRYEICRRLDIPFTTIAMEFTDRNDAMIWVIRNQFGRRNLNDFQRADLAIRLAAFLEEPAKEKQRLGGQKKVFQNSEKAIDTTKEAAKAAGVSHDTVSKVKTIRAKASPKVREMAAGGEVKIDAAAKVATLPPDEQEAVASAGPAAVKAKAAEMRRGPAPEPVKDREGQPIPDALKPVFANASEHDAALQKLRELTEIVNRIMGDGKDRKPILGGELLAGVRQEVLRDLKNLGNAIKFARPHAVCPYSHANGKCDVCHGLGWVNKIAYEQGKTQRRAA